MMQRVFDELGYRRYEWKCDALNAPSRAAAGRYGFRYEGLFRQATITRGRNRDTTWFSIIDTEWPAIRAALRGLARSRQFRGGRHPASRSGEFPPRIDQHDPRVPSLWLLAAVTALGFASLHIVVPALPLLARVLRRDRRLRCSLC